jgi:hypothetical protein
MRLLYNGIQVKWNIVRELKGNTRWVKQQKSKVY